MDGIRIPVNVVNNLIVIILTNLQRKIGAPKISLAKKKTN